LNPLSTKCDPLADHNLCTECAVPGDPHFEQSLTMINCMPGNQNCRKYNHENPENSRCLIENRSWPSTQNVCIYSIGKPKDVISEGSFASVSGCECCPILEGSDFCQAHSLYVIGSRSSVSSPSPHYYGYDSEYSGAETEIHCYDPSSDSQEFELAEHMPVFVDAQINAMTGIESLRSNCKASSDELKQNILCGSAINTLKQIPVKYFYPDTGHRKLKFFKTEDDSTAAVIKESHSVEVLGSYCMKQFSNILNNPVFLKSSAPSGLTSTEDLGTDSGSEDCRHLSGISDRIKSNGCSDEFVSNNLTPTSENRKFSVLIEKPYNVNKTIRRRKHSTDKLQAAENEDEVPERSAVKFVALQNNEVLDSNRNERQFNNRKEPSEMNLIIGNNDNTNLSSKAGENSRGGAISSHKSSTMTTHNSCACKTTAKNLVIRSLSQSELISRANSVTDNIHSNKVCEVGDKNNSIASLDDACTTHQTNPANPIMQEIYSSWISSGNKKASESVYIEKSSNSRLSDGSNGKDALSCVSLISDLLEIRSLPEGKVSYIISDEANNRYVPDVEVSIVDNAANLELSNCCKSTKKSTHMGHKRKSISNGNVIGSMVDLVVSKDSGSPEQHSYVEFEYCKKPVTHRQPVVDIHADNGDANFYPLLMSHALTPSQFIMTTNLDLQQHTNSAPMTNEKWNVPLPGNEYSDYGSSSGGGGGQRMEIHHSGAQGANSSSGSKRNTFTRSLSNADVPSDEKAGKCKNELV
jgi:hypothetical protein